MFHSLTLHGGTATVLWGYRTAAVLRTWRIFKQKGTWMLAATLERAEPFMCRQKPLYFTAPREHKGMWCWAVQSIDLVGPNQLRAILGPPEQ